MRSVGFTLLLALLAAFTCGVAGWQWTGGNFDSILGVPPTPVGQRIYTSFTADMVKNIKVSQNGVSATFSLTQDGWQSLTPWQDRMDPRAAVGIVNFALGMRVEDFSPVDKIDRQKAGLRETGIDVWLEDSNHQRLARFKIGRRTPWMAEVKDVEEPVPTVFVWPRDENRKGYVYTCTGDIGPLFKDGLKFLRDHRPFYFNPLNLKKIRIRAAQELTLARETPEAGWHITKPLNSPVDRKAVVALIEGLYQLQAVHVSDRAAVTLPTAGTTTGTPGQSTQIAITSFGSDTETTLDIFPTESAESTDAHATVSNRPNTVFDLPVKPEANVVSLANLPLAVDDLRDPTLANIDIKLLRSVLIQPSTGSEILVSRTPPQPWMTTIDGHTDEANEGRLFALLKAVTEGRAIGFPSDAATDFTPWGLDKPFLKLQFLGETQGREVKVQLAFGMDGKGGFFVNRPGTPTVMRVEEGLVAAISVRQFEWRPSRLWSVDRNNLLTIGRQQGKESPLLLRYIFNPETWEAKQDNKDLTAEINPNRANYMLGILEGLKVSRWLRPDDEAAEAALLAPVLTFTVVERTTNDMGDSTGLIKRTVRFAPNTPGPNPRFYYGRLDSDAQPFMLDKDTFGKLATDLLDKR